MVFCGAGIEEIINRPRDRSKRRTLLGGWHGRWAVIRTRMQVLKTVAKERKAGRDRRQSLGHSGMVHTTRKAVWKNLKTLAVLI